MEINRKVDHIVYCVLDLEKAINDIESLLGVRPVIGGSHFTKGTKNALLNLGKECYLEILARDENNADFEDQRWMGVDLIDVPKITRWSLKSDDLVRDSIILSEKSIVLGRIDGGSRQTTNGQLLSWHMILPTSSPEVELLPFMTDWSTSSVHPTDNLEEACSLQSIKLYHPDPSEVQTVLSNLGIVIEVIKDSKIKVSIEIRSPKGIKVLS